MATQLREDLLFSILSQPTAPFREGHIISLIQQTLRQGGVPHFLDPIGNVIVGVSSRSEYLRLVKQKTSEPLRIFIAHMDHPGFHGHQWNSDGELEIKWHGGSPTEHMEGSRVWLSNRSGWKGTGVMRHTKLLPSGRALESAVVTLDRSTSRPSPDTPAHSLYGGFRFKAPVWTEGPLIYTHAADDLVGSFAIVSMALDYFKGNKKKKRPPSHPPFLGLLTRAEEVGFIGALGHFELKWLTPSSKQHMAKQHMANRRAASRATKRPVVCVSLETSRTLPGAEIGKGPVVRLGDRFTVFDPGALRVLTDVAESILPGRHQRRIMDGGSCEASAATVYGLPCVGISVPLGNYHNQSLEGGPDAAPTNGPAPEFVHREDVLGLVELCHGLLKPKLPWLNPWNLKQKELKKGLLKYRPLLRTKH